MNTIKLYYTCILLLIIYSCGSNPYPQTMQIADSLANTNPDSALILLNKIKNSIRTEPEAIQIYFHLLTIKAKDKAYIVHTSDSLIKQVVEYYEKKKDKRHLPEAYYYAGRIYRDKGDAPLALDYFQKAIEVSEETTDQRLISRIYSQTGMIFLNQDIYDKALETFCKAYQQNVLIKDSASIVYNLRDLGRVYTGLNNVDSTLYYYKKAEEVARRINNIYLVRLINQEIAGIYIQLKEFEKAQQSIQIAQGSFRGGIAPYYSVLAELYYQTGKNDSAQYYYQQLTSIGNHYHKQAAYKGLCRIARHQGHLSEALDYMDKYLIFTDTIQKETNAEAIHKVNALYNYQLYKKENYRLENIAETQRFWILLLSASLISILLIAFIVIITRKLQKRQQLMQKEKLEALVQEHYHNSQQFIYENEARIIELQEKLENTTIQKDELTQSLQEAEKELLEITNKQIETRKKIQTLSETALKESQIYKDFHHVAGSDGFVNSSDKKNISPEDWDELTNSLNRTYNNFTIRLTSFYPHISNQELRLSLLIKINISASGMAKITLRSKQAISSARKALYEKTHNQSGKPEQWDTFIHNF